MTKNINILEKNIYFGIDEMEFNLDLKNDFLYYSEIVQNIDYDNTPDGYIDIGGLIFKYEKTTIKNYDNGFKFSCSIDGLPVSCFSIFHGKEQNQLKKGGKTKDKVVLYSSFFVLDYINKLPFNMQEFIGLCFIYNNLSLYRLDICLDVPATIKQLKPYFLDLKKPTSGIGTDKKHPEFYQTYYLGEIQNSKNRNSLIRIYDKILDTFKKKKGFLYPHLVDNTDVRRIELEIRPEQAKRFQNYSILDLLDNKNYIIGDIFAKYLNKKIPEKYHLDYTKLNLYKFSKRSFNLKKAFLDFGHIPKDYLKRSYGYIKNILDNTGYTGLFQLLFNSEYSDIFLQKNIKSCVNNILNNKKYKLMINSKSIQNPDNTINAGYDLLEELIIFLKSSPYISHKKINKILKKHTTPIKLKLKK